MLFHLIEDLADVTPHYIISSSCCLLLFIQNILCFYLHQSFKCWT